MSLAVAAAWGLALFGLLVHLAVIRGFLSKPDRVPVAGTEYFVDTWHVPTLAFLVGGLLVLVGAFAVGLYPLALGRAEGLLAGVVYLGLATLAAEATASPIAHYTLLRAVSRKG